MDTMELEIGFGIIPLVDAAQGGTLLNRIKSIRRQIALEMGFIVPPVKLKHALLKDFAALCLMCLNPIFQAQHLPLFLDVFL